MVDDASRRPGLAKARPLPVLGARHRPVRVSDARWGALFDRAQVLSEGAARDDAPRRMWYGSTSVLLPLSGLLTEEVLGLASIASADPSVRIRAARVARCEASLRAPAPLGTARCVVTVRAQPFALRIDVDVEAPIMEAPAQPSGAGSKRGARSE
jgi:hypothetical protein